MSKTNKQKELTRGELKSRKRMYKAKKNWVVAGATVAMGMLALGATMEATPVHAEAWVANSTEQIASRISEGQTSITMEDGDTVWEIGQAINISNPMNLLKDNGIAEGQQYTLEIGTVISWDGNHVTVKDSKGTVIGDKIVSDDEKVDSSKTVAGQATDEPQARGGQLEEKSTEEAQAEKTVTPSTNSGVTTPNTVVPSIPAVDNGTKNETVKPVIPSNPVEKPAEKPVTPENPVKPEVKKFAVTVIYKDTDGNILGKDSDVSVEENQSFTAKAKSFDGFTLVGNATQTVKVTADTTITFTYKANEVTPPTPVEKFNVTINYVDTEGNAIAKADVVSVEKGETYTAYATTLAGYTLQGEGTQTVTADSDKEVTFVYKKEATPVEKFAVTVKYVDEDGKEIASTDTNEVEKGESFTATAKTVDGYTLQGDTTQTVNVDGNKTITFTYKKDVAPVQKFDVTVNFVDEDGNTIADKDVVSVEEGQKYTATAKTVDGYTLQGANTQEVTVDGNKTITFNYTKNVAPVEKFDITTKFVDESGKEIATAETQEVEKGQVFTAQAKDIADYTLQGNATQTITVTGNQTITFTYKKDVAPVEKFNVTVEYKDTDGNILATDTPVEVEKGASFTATAKTIEGYTVYGSTSQTITVDGNKTITFFYKKDAVVPTMKYSVTVVYREVDSKGTQVKLLGSNPSEEVLEGTTFTATAKEFDGYTLVGDTTQTEVVDGDKLIVFDYVKDVAPVVVDKSELQTVVNNVKDTQKGNFTDDSFATFETNLTVAQQVLADKDATQQEVDNAEANLQTAFDNLVEKPAPVVNYTVTTTFVTTDGTTLDTATATVKEGESFTATAKTFEGYTLQGDSTQTVTVTGNTTLTFTYKLNEVTPPTQNVSEVEAQIASQTMSLINEYRNQNGLKSLRSQAQIQTAVNDRANEIVTDYSHNNTTGGMGMDDSKYGYNGMSTGENIGRYNNPSSLDYFIQNGASLAFNAWVNSPDHNAYLLASDITEGAVGIHLEDNGSGKYTMFSVFIGGLQDD